MTEDLPIQVICLYWHHNIHLFIDTIVTNRQKTVQLSNVRHRSAKISDLSTHQYKIFYQSHNFARLINNDAGCHVLSVLIHAQTYQHNICMYVCRFQNVVLRCPTPRLHYFLSSHWISFRFLSFTAFLIPSIQSFFGLPRVLFCFGIHFNAILGNLPSAILWTWPYHVSWFCSIALIIGTPNPICCQHNMSVHKIGKEVNTTPILLYISRQRQIVWMFSLFSRAIVINYTN